ncbi:MAG: RNA polymerase sigma factor [Anaerolineales bacterium]|jgi:RNA polymerase sigma-70 factor (ECF subfamily)
MDYIIAHKVPGQYDNQSDDALVRITEGQPEAFGILYRRHVTPIYRYIVARVGHESDAQDITTETFMAALQGIRTYRGTDRFRSWLFGIARNKVAMYYRQHSSTLSLEAAEDVPHPDPTPDVVIDKQLRLRRISRILKVLSPDRAEAVTLSLIVGLSTAEIAKLMSRSEAAIRMLVYRGVKDLRERLIDSAEDEL